MYEWGAVTIAQTAVLSLPGADARLRTDTTWTETDRGVPIYWLNGARVADDYADFYDGSWENEDKPRNGLGNPRPLAGTAPWTGTDHDGTELFDGERVPGRRPVHRRRREPRFERRRRRTAQRRRLVRQQRTAPPVRVVASHGRRREPPPAQKPLQTVTTETTTPARP